MGDLDFEFGDIFFYWSRYIYYLFV